MCIPHFRRAVICEIGLELRRPPWQSISSPRRRLIFSTPQKMFRTPSLPVVLAALAFCTLPAVVCAQDRNNNAGNFHDRTFAPPNRTVMRMLDLAQKLIDQGRHGDAVKMLNEVLNPAPAADNDEDYFFREPGAGDGSGGQRFQSLRSEARRLIGQLPKAARESYELRYGVVAQEKLDRAIAAGDIELLSEVQRRYFHTRAGYQAMLLLGRYHLDHGRPIMAALLSANVINAFGALFSGRLPIASGQFLPAGSIPVVSQLLESCGRRRACRGNIG